MKKRVLGSALFVIVIGAFLILREQSLLYFDALVLFMIMVGAFEMSRALKDYLTKANHMATAIYIFFILPVFYYMGGFFAVLILFMLYFWAVALISIYSKGYGFQNFSAAVLLGLYPIIMFALLLEINHWETNSTLALLLIFLVGPFCDVLAYIVGSTVKGPKLCPSISPNKTISGAVGGIIGGIIGSLTVYFIYDYALFPSEPIAATSIWFFVFFGFIGGIFTEFGDLVESAIKRSLNIKDMGNLIPGHGGILDRFDGVLFVVFMTYIYFRVFSMYM